MQFLTIASLLLVSFIASLMALPARLAYYQQQPAFYYQSRASPQRLVYMQYVQQPTVPRTSGRLTNGAAAFVAGNTVTTGTSVKDDRSAEQQIAASETVLDNTGANGAQSVAEAYPDEYPQDDGLGYEAPSQAVEYEVPQVPEVPELPQLEDEAVPEASPDSAIAPAAAAPAVPAVQEPVAAAVELEEEVVENDDDSNNVSSDDDEDEYVPKDSRRRAVAKATTAAPLPAGSFFSVDFGGAKGGAIAISNSYSTGSNGSAKSQAIAFGNPEDDRLKNAPSRHRH